jgi:hypothetical protein
MRSSASRAVSPFIGSVEAAASVLPSGERVTEPAGSTRSSR